MWEEPDRNKCNELYKICPEDRSVEWDYGIHYTAKKTFILEAKCEQTCWEIKMQTCKILQAFDQFEADKKRDLITGRENWENNWKNKQQEIEKTPNEQILDWDDNTEKEHIEPKLRKKWTNRWSTRKKQIKKQNLGLNKNSTNDDKLWDGTELPLEDKPKKRKWNWNWKVNLSLTWKWVKNRRWNKGTRWEARAILNWKPGYFK